jgi:GAF domain-containing protein
VFSPTTYDWTDKRVAYDALVHDLTHLLGDERNLVANASQAAALIWHALPDLNWAGF